MADHIYEVTVEITLPVLAPDRRTAERIAEDHWTEECNPSCFAREITDAKRMPGDWEGCLPYRDRSDKRPDETCEQILARIERETDEEDARFGTGQVKEEGKATS